ncbi:MAG: hypothetical protein AVDCRST_MAG17-509, partial [uncultured Solirubrobacterales bacterium]
VGEHRPHAEGLRRLRARRPGDDPVDMARRHRVAGSRLRAPSAVGPLPGPRRGLRDVRAASRALGRFQGHSRRVGGAGRHRDRARAHRGAGEVDRRAGQGAVRPCLAGQGRQGGACADPRGHRRPRRGARRL